jgi:hypothetical protein
MFNLYEVAAHELDSEGPAVNAGDYPADDEVFPLL